MNESTLGERVKQSRKALGLTQLQLATQCGVKQPTISSIERGDTVQTLNLATIASVLQVNALWLDTGVGDPKTSVTGRAYLSQVGGREVSRMEYEIPVLPSRGSCGGGAVGKPNIEDLTAAIGPVAKDQGFFTSRGIDAGEVIALIADGDGMANFIVHGDTVLFNTTLRSRIESGQIYALETPDGPVIRRVHRKTDGTLVLSFDSVDKTRYPDEQFTAEKAEALVCLGQYIYRQG